MVKFYIYKHTNLINGKIYIGKSNNPKSRWHRHIYDANKSKNNGSKQLLFHKAINKYGSQNFVMEILAEYNTNEEALFAEKTFISKLKSNDLSVGYNLTTGGEGVAGYTRTPEDCLNISIRNSGPHNGNYEKIESVEKRKSRGTKISKTKNKLPKPVRIISKNTIQKLQSAVKEKSSHKLTDEQKDEIVRDYNLGLYIKRHLADKYEVELKTIAYVIRYWEQVKNNKNNHLTNEQKKNIIDLYVNHTMKQVSEITGINIGRIESVIKMHQRKVRTHK